MQHSSRIKKLERFIRILSLLKVPLLGLSGPRVVDLTSTKAVVQLPLKFLTKNHLGSMYFGALTMGAELSIAVKLLARMREERLPINFIFKDFSCEFHKRAEEDVQFITESVAEIDKLIEEALRTGDRVNGTFEGYAIGVSHPENRLMSYRVTISIKKTPKRS